MKKALIYGFNFVGKVIYNIINNNIYEDEIVCCFVDDNKQGENSKDVLVYYGRDKLVYVVEKFNIDIIYLSISELQKNDKIKILELCNKLGCEIVNLPCFEKLWFNKKIIEKINKVDMNKLLNREVTNFNMDNVSQYIKNKTVLITGIGSIGSELARQVAVYNPSRLILLDVYENNAYKIQLELKKTFLDLNVDVVICSITDTNRVSEVFDKYKPNIVYHTAAHKHVPLMEDNPCEAIKNNVIGTYNLAYAAMTFDCSKFVFISTDKAVNPTNIMGASKRLCEMMIQSFNTMIKNGDIVKLPKLFDIRLDSFNFENLNKAKTEFVSVRFGNVLGSNGSVVEVFKEQIESGGPIVVTDPNVTRYFMTVQEAVSLVLIAGTYADCGEIYILDMGEPIKIIDLAYNLVKCYGYIPNIDIKIKYSGLRKGEKMYEEKLMAEEGLEKTNNDLIYVGKPICFNVNVFFEQLKELFYFANNNHKDIKVKVSKIVETYNIN